MNTNKENETKPLYRITDKQKLTKIRNRLRDRIPKSELSTCDLLIAIKLHLDELDEFIDKMDAQCVSSDVEQSLPNDDEIERAADEEASRIFDGTGSGSEWYARHQGFTDGVEWIKNYLTK